MEIKGIRRVALLTFDLFTLHLNGSLNIEVGNGYKLSGGGAIAGQLLVKIKRVCAWA